VSCIRQTLEPSTPGDVAIAFGSLTSNQAVSFRPRGFSPPRRLTPCSEPQAYCNLMPARIRHVSRTPHPSCPPGTEAPYQTVRTTLFVPRNAVHTPRRIPLANSRTTSLRPLPSCCFRPPTTFNTEVPSCAWLEARWFFGLERNNAPVPESHNITG